MRQSVRPTKRRSGRTGSFSKVALGHSHRFLGLGISGSRVCHCSSARSHVGSILVLMPLLTPAQHQVGDGWRNYFRFANHPLTGDLAAKH